MKQEIFKEKVNILFLALKAIKRKRKIFNCPCLVRLPPYCIQAYKIFILFFSLLCSFASLIGNYFLLCCRYRWPGLPCLARSTTGWVDFGAFIFLDWPPSLRLMMEPVCPYLILFTSAILFHRDPSSLLGALHPSNNWADADGGLTNSA